MFQGEKAETTQAHRVASLHAGVVLSVISVFLQINILCPQEDFLVCLPNFPGPKVISQVLKYSSDIAKLVFFPPNENCLDNRGW